MTPRCDNPEPMGHCRCDLEEGHAARECRCYGYTAGVGIATTVLTLTHPAHEWWTMRRVDKLVKERPCAR